MATPRLRQVCLVAPALAAPERALAAVLGAASCHRDPHLARYGLENVIFRLGDRFIEIVAPTEDAKLRLLTVKLALKKLAANLRVPR